VMFTGSAPLTADVRAFIREDMGCPLIEVYGQTECNAGAIFSRAGGVLDG
jgi:long-subunit acyl-CoA synthetase (AMP-forming)